MDADSIFTAHAEAFDKAAANVDMISRIRIDDTKLQ